MIVKRFKLAHGTVLVNVFVNAVARCGHDIAENSVANSVCTFYIYSYTE